MLIFEIVTLIILITLSALFSACETALTSISKLRLKHLINESGERTHSLKLWLSNPTRILTSILVFNNVVNIIASSLTTVITLKYFPNLGVAFGVGIITFVLLVLGEIVPKNLARKYSEEIAVFLIKPIDVLTNIFSPIISLLVNISNAIINFFDLPQKAVQEVVTEQEIKMMIDIGQKEGVVEKREQEMLHRIFRFNDVQVKTIMIPKEKMVCGNTSMNIQEVFNLVVIKDHSRIPIYENSIDNIIGIIHERDLMYGMNENKLININDCLREPFKVNEDFMIDDLLHEFQNKMIHIAIVVDKNGKTLGLVTIEDIIEEIVGEIEEKLSRRIRKN